MNPQAWWQLCPCASFVSVDYSYCLVMPSKTCLEELESRWARLAGIAWPDLLALGVSATQPINLLPVI